MGNDKAEVRDWVPACNSTDNKTAPVLIYRMLARKEQSIDEINPHDIWRMQGSESLSLILEHAVGPDGLQIILAG